MIHPLYVGIDLAGYSTRNTAVCFLREVDDHLVAELIPHSPLNCKMDGKSRLAEHSKREAEWLADLLNHAQVAVDVPIDLQNLPTNAPVTYVWELTKRPIDFAFGALPPLADRLGAVVARFAYLLSNTPGARGKLEERLFETYPALTLRCLGLRSEGYKGGKAQFSRRIWVADDPSEKSNSLSEIANSLNLTAEEKTILDDNELDAIVAAVALLGRVSKPAEQLEREMRAALNTPFDSRISIPNGYIVGECLPNCEIEVSRAQSIK